MKLFYVRFLILFVSFLCIFQSFARVVVPGERLWNLQKLVTEASCDTTISQADFTAGVKTISQNGVYVLAESVTGKIIINANNVVLDLNGKKITNTTDNSIVVSSVSKCSILNGIVSSTTGSGILVNSGSQLNIEYISANNCIEGIRLEDVVDAQVEHCDLVSSTTGITLSNSSRVSVLDTIALSNTNAGFSLFSSEKNLICDCKAVKTGQGQTGYSQNLYGFVSDDGQGNIFDSCIVQSTLATTVTDSSSAVVGFAFTGTETNSEISNCKSDIVQTGVQNGYAVPYGIWLEPQFDQLVSVTNVSQGTTAFSVAWSPDGSYLATIGDEIDTYEIQIFLFDRVGETFTRTDSANQGSFGYSVAWSPDGNYLATCGETEGADEVQVFSFNSTTGKLTKTSGVSQGTGGYGVAWSSNGAYLATCGATEGGTDEIQIFSFNSTGTGGLVKTDGAAQGTIGNAVAWHPSGDYLASAGSAEGGNEIRVFSFNRALGTLSFTDGASQGTVGYSVAWSPDGNYLATAGKPESGDEVQLFSFDSSAGTITKVDGQSQGTTQARGVGWSPDGKYLVSTALITGDDVQVYSLDPVSETLTIVDGLELDTLTGVYSLSWIPDGSYLAVSSDNTLKRSVTLLKFYTFPTLNVIKNNVVHGASGGASSGLGVGICGSSIENFIVGNFAYDNASFNYQFVPNVFDQRFDSTTSDVQNIGMKTQNPVYAP